MQTLAPPDYSEVLVVELQGMVSNSARGKGGAATARPTAAAVTTGAAAAAGSAAARAAGGGRRQTAEPQPQVSPPQPQVPPQARQVQDPDEQQKAQILKTERDLEASRLREYIKRLSKKVQANLVYPDEGRKAMRRCPSRSPLTGRSNPAPWRSR